jgi:cytoskeleton protein RodZ
MLADSNKASSGAEDAAQPHAETEHSLRATRERLQFTVDDVANALHLSREHILALEAGDFDGLGPQVFVRGYLRGYAKLLGLSEQSVLAAFPLLDVRSEEFQTMSLRADDLKPGFYPRAWMMWAMLGLILLIAGLIFFVSTSGTDKDPAAVASADGSDQTVTPAAATSAAGKRPESSFSKPRFTVIEPGLGSANPAVPGFPITTTDPAAASETTIGTEAATVAATEVATEVATETTTAADAGTATAPEGLNADNEADSTLAPAASVLAETSLSSAPAAGKVRLTLSFSDDCWVEVADSQRSLLYGLEKPGSVVDLDGVPPFKLFFGNREAVQIALAGKPFAIPASAADSGNTARFTIKEEQL